MTQDSLSSDGGPAADASPNEAFAALGDETRIAILRALFEAPYEPMAFSDLREAVGTRDSGQFNYHLNKLVGRFVRKTDDGYRLRLAGWHVLGAILSGTYTESGEADPVAFDHDCPDCGGTVVATYADERMTAVCEDCGGKFSSAGVPPGALEGVAREDRPDRFDRWLRGLMNQAQLGICPTCTGRMDPKILTDATADSTSQIPPDADFPRVVYRCHRCPEIVTAAVETVLVNHPAVVAYHWERGIDLREAPTWTLPWRNDAKPVVESDDPVRVRVTVRLDDSADTLELVVDENANVVEIEHR